MTFTEEILSGTIVVRKAGAVVSRGTGGKDPGNVRRLRVAMKSGLGTGRFVVNWTVTAPDGHHQHGSFSFRVT
jgi:methionine-rich copper-binding protein CopC